MKHPSPWILVVVAVSSPACQCERVIAEDIDTEATTSTSTAGASSTFPGTSSVASEESTGGWFDASRWIGRYHYEDLVLDMPGTAERLGSWLGVPLDAQSTARDKSFRSKHMTAATPEQSVGRWRDEMEPEVAERFSRDLGPELRALGLEA